MVKKGDKAALLKALKRLNRSIDLVGDHIQADEALLAYIGDKDISEAYRRIQKEYA